MALGRNLSMSLMFHDFVIVVVTNMKILYLITKSNFGGAQRYVFDLATEMTKLEQDVVVAFGGEGVLATKLKEMGVRTLGIPRLERDVNILADFKTFFFLLDLYAAEQPDIIHLNSSKIGALGALAGRLYNVWTHILHFLGKGGVPARIIFTGHGWAFNEQRNDLERFIIGSIHWLTIRLAHQTIAVSGKTREQVGVLPFSWHKLTVIHNGVGNITLLSRNDAQKRILQNTPWGEKEFSPETIFIGTLAELHKNKGLNFAIEGLAQLKKQIVTPFVFIILGEGEERAALQKQITEAGLEEQVLLAGYKEGGAGLLSAFDIFLLPSVTEAFPYAILEAGKAGLPTIASNVGGIPEIIDDMQSGILIHSRNAGEITRALKFLIENPDRRKEFSDAIAHRILDRFDLTQMTKETLALYEQKT
ncbi:MAG: hypothetical protein A2494_01965 [Candidatus Lloydbacteria bacterium RIFOXYC12_FULL_46_25]|uniref:Glycosyltransferase subfamily 4-like N-terminal domain-containing protein n=1 Tax=Candidatus Lloydbacteria bacterium RIFOXYC12_FULL_46_25 TaxID=1798670 RepID=A0A1G2DV73_9BACT|nr:MAG: hypothetical protein A2494_01965 [Candidatus Lloydbacteria bacterium RIFOXYC12_FULL_46_25]